MSSPTKCIECGVDVPSGSLGISTALFAYPLCKEHQAWISQRHISKEARKLYLALKASNLPVELEHDDGNKRVDIAIPNLLHIEVNGEYHNSPEQSLIDFYRLTFSLKKYIPTIPIPNSLIQNKHSFEQTVRQLRMICIQFLNSTTTNRK